MTGDADVRQLTRAAAIGVHDPNFQPPAQIRLVGDESAIRGKERIDVHARVRSQTPQCTIGDFYLPYVRGPRTGGEESNLPFIRRPVRLEVATMAGCNLARVGIGGRKQPDVHVSGTIGVEGHRFTVRRPRPPAVLSSRAHHRLRRTPRQSSLREDWKLPDVGILMQRGKSETLAIG